MASILYVLGTILFVLFGLYAIARLIKSLNIDVEPLMLGVVKKPTHQRTVTVTVKGDDRFYTATHLTNLEDLTLFDVKSIYGNLPYGQESELEFSSLAFVLNLSEKSKVKVPGHIVYSYDAKDRLAVAPQDGLKEYTLLFQMPESYNVHDISFSARLTVETSNTAYVITEDVTLLED